MVIVEDTKGMNIHVTVERAIVWETFYLSFAIFFYIVFPFSSS